MTKLIIIKGSMEGYSFDLKEGTTTIGRSYDNDILIHDPSVSRKHARIFKEGDQFYIEDLNSYNGIWIGGKRIEASQRFKVERGAPISIGGVICSIGIEDIGEELDITCSIDMSAQIFKKERNLLYKDEDITDRRNLEIIHEVSTVLMQSLDINEICGALLDSLFMCLKRIDSGTILLIDDDTGDLRELMTRARNRKEHISGNYSHTIVNRVIEEGKAVIMSDTSRENDNDLSESIEMMRIKSIMCVPLISKYKIKGVIYVHSINVPQGFRKEDLFLFTALSSPAALAIDNARLYQQRIIAEDALKESEEKYRILVDNANDAILVVRNGKIEYANPSAYVWLGYNEAELSHIPFIDLFHEDDKDSVLQRQKKRMKGARVLSNYTSRILNIKKEVNWVQGNDVVITWKGKPATLNFLRDITREKILENQLLQSHRMEAVSMLAGGLSHDFNNLLMGIQGNASLMRFEIPDESPHVESLKQIEECVGKGARITEGLLGFAWRGNYMVQPNDLNWIISETVESVFEKEKKTRVHKKLASDLWLAEVDYRQIERAFVNIFEHAVQAIGKEGDIYLETENVLFDEESLGPVGTGRGKYVRFSMTEPDIGIDEESKIRIFDPYYLSDKFDIGNKSGLAAAYGIIKNHEGSIDIVSNKGKCTTFNVYLPAQASE